MVKGGVQVTGDIEGDMSRFNLSDSSRAVGTMTVLTAMPSASVRSF